MEWISVEERLPERDVWVLGWCSEVEVSIMGKQENFRIGVTSNDKRFGCLSYGFLLPNEGRN